MQEVHLPEAQVQERQALQSLQALLLRQALQAAAAQQVHSLQRQQHREVEENAALLLVEATAESVLGTATGHSSDQQSPAASVHAKAQGSGCIELSLGVRAHARVRRERYARSVL